MNIEIARGLRPLAVSVIAPLAFLFAFCYTSVALAASCPSTAATNQPVYYAQLEASYQVSISSWEKGASVNEGPGDPYDSLQGTEQYDSQYATLVWQHLQTLGIDGVGTNLITSDYQTALATWQAETQLAEQNTPSWSISQWYTSEQSEITNAYNQAISASNAANGTLCSSQPATPAPANAFNSAPAFGSTCGVAGGGRVADINGLGVCVDLLSYCQDTYGAMATANSDGSCYVSCPSGYAYASSTKLCNPMMASSPIVAPAAAPAAISPTLPTIIRAPQTSSRPTLASVAPIEASTTIPISASSTEQPVPPHIGIWARIVRAFNPLSWFS